VASTIFSVTPYNKPKGHWNIISNLHTSQFIIPYRSTAGT
jgi:hypothetical protein